MSHEIPRFGLQSCTDDSPESPPFKHSVENNQH
jgi:hypothetical protein